MPLLWYKFAQHVNSEHIARLTENHSQFETYMQNVKENEEKKICKNTGNKMN